jgi:hypothetical protein
MSDLTPIIDIYPPKEKRKQHGTTQTNLSKNRNSQGNQGS